MKTILNPNAQIIDLKIHINIELLETEGWDFHQYHLNTAEAKGVTIEQAQDYNYSNYIAEITLRGGSNDYGTNADIKASIETVETSISWRSIDRNENTESEPTGDDVQTIKDIINLLDQNLITISDNLDCTVDENDKYIPTFIQQD